jgi:5,6,7,8-tetrahydromethanopterin hydro-lyase
MRPEIGLLLPAAHKQDRRLAKISEGETVMAKITKVGVGESLVGEGNEVAHIDLIIGPRGSAAETAFCNALTNNKDGFTTLLAVVAPNLLAKPNTILFNKVTIKDAKQAVQMFGPAQHGVSMAVADSVAEGVIPADEADDLFISVGVFIHWDATDDKKIQKYNYEATKERSPAPSPASRLRSRCKLITRPQRIRSRPDSGRDRSA